MTHEADTLADEVAQLKGELATMRAELARLRQSDDADARPAVDGDELAVAHDSSRRALLRRGAIAVGAGIAGVGLSGQRAAAADLDPVLLGTGHDSTGSTVITCSGVSTDAIAGYSSALTGASWGVRGESASVDGVGVFGRAANSFGRGTGVRGAGEGIGGIGVRGSADSPDGATVGVYGSVTSPDGTGVVGENASADPGGIGVAGVGGNGVGAEFSGQIAALRLKQSGDRPTTRVDSHTVGEVYLDNAGALWACTSAGEPRHLEQAHDHRPQPGSAIPRLRFANCRWPAQRWW